MSNTAVTADDLYGDLGSVSAAPAPPHPPPVEQPAPPAAQALEEENAALRGRVDALETEARVWAAQRAVLVSNLGALLRTAKAVDARRVREIHALREQAAGAVSATQPLPESRQSAPEERKLQAASSGGGKGVVNRAGEARDVGLARAREGYRGGDRGMREEPRNWIRRDEQFHKDEARRRSSRDEERGSRDDENKGGDMGRRESRFGGPRGRREDTAEFYGSDEVRRRSYDERWRRGDDRDDGHR